MSYTKLIGTYLSSDGSTEVQYYLYLPEGNPSAILQISHGMKEYIERYEAEGFVTAMTDAGFVVCGNDHLGHGNTATETTLGHFTAYKHLTEDLHTLNGIVRRRYPSLPYVLLGHSMGSFAARDYMVAYSDIDGVIVMGTSAGHEPLGLGKAIASLIGKVKGKEHRSPLLLSLSWRGYNRGLEAEKDRYSWLSRDPDVRRRYGADPKCNFLLSAAAWHAVYEMMQAVCDPAWVEQVPLSLPVYLLSGEADPLAEGGEGIEELYAELENRELNVLKKKLYAGARHEILNDYCRTEVYEDIIAFVREVTEGVIAWRSYGNIPFGKVDFA